MKKTCKFCGKPIKVGQFLSNPKLSCGECSEYCMQKCPIASKSTTSWHTEPCVSCTHNPYKINHTWSGKEWMEND